MAITDVDLATLNAAAKDYSIALRDILIDIAAGEELAFARSNRLAIVAEAVGTAATNGETKGDFKLGYPVDSAEDVIILLDGTAIADADIIDGDTGSFTTGTQVKVYTDKETDSGWLEFDSALGTEVITATYTVGKTEDNEFDRRHEFEDETVNFVTSAGNNLRAKANFRSMVGAGIWSSADSV